VLLAYLTGIEVGRREHGAQPKPKGRELKAAHIFFVFLYLFASF
jgi:hypothetical protein